MENYISFEHGDRLEELLDQLARTTRLLEQHDRGDDDDALADAVVQLLIAEETLTRAVDDLLEEAVVHGDESLRGLAAMYRAVSTDRRPNHSSLLHRLRRGQQWRATPRRGLRMTARPEALHPGDWLDLDGRGVSAVYRAVPADRRPNLSSLLRRLRRGQQWRATHRRGLRMTARPEELHPGDWLDLDGLGAVQVEAVGEVVELGEQVIVRLRD